MVILTLKQGNLIMYQPSYQGMYECFWHNTLSPHKESEVVILSYTPLIGGGLYYDEGKLLWNRDGFCTGDHDNRLAKNIACILNCKIKLVS